MRIRKIFLLLIFIFSLLIANLHYSKFSPPLLDKSVAKNLIILSEVKEEINASAISFELSSDNSSYITSNNYKDILPIFTLILLINLKVLKIEPCFYKLRKYWGLYSILFWDKRRVLRN